MKRRKKKNDRRRVDRRYRRLGIELLEGRCLLASDFGDAPAPYPVTIAEVGAEHTTGGALKLGATVDSEANGTHSAGATADGTDEDGVTFGTMMVGQLGATVMVNVQGAVGKLDAWIDFNGDGSWGGPGEQIANSVSVVNGDNTITFDVPSFAIAGTTYARFRLSAAGGLGVDGSAADGEVEDYQVTIANPAATPGEFGGQNMISTAANGAIGVFAADVDGDGDLDVLSASNFDDKIAWYENDGSQNFTPHTISTAANGAYGVFAADVDGDGDLDVLSASNFDDKIAWYENDGSQNFTAQTISMSADFALSVFAADMDGDGDLDVLSTSFYDNKIAWYENDGSQNFTPHTISTAADNAQSVFAADVDGDGDLDVLSASLGDDKIAWYENDGSQNFTPHTISTAADQARSVFAADVDGDGDLDVLSASANDDKIAWYENDGSQNFTPHTISTAADSARSVFAVDVDGDGDLDVLSASPNDDKIAWYENDGSQNFTPHTISTAAVHASSVFAADVDGDGDLDVLSASIFDDKIAWYENIDFPRDLGDAPDPALGTAVGNYETVLANSGPSHVIVAGLFLGDTVDADSGTLQNALANADDVDPGAPGPDDEDGVLDPLDLLGTEGAAATVTLLVTNTTGGTATLSGWIDFNADGVFDNGTERAQAAVVTGTTDGRVTLTFPAVPTGSAGATYARFRLSTDVAAQNSTGAANDGEVEDYVFSITAPANQPVAIASHTKISDGLAGFLPNGLIGSDQFGSAVASLGDLDGDGVVDLAVGASGDENTQSAEGAVYVLFMNSNGTVKSHRKISDGLAFTPNGLIASDRFGGALANLGDLNGDGVVDLAVGAWGDENTQASEGAVYVLLMDTSGLLKGHTKISDGLAGFTPSGLIGSDFFGSALASLGDLDGDGVVDLAVGASGDENTQASEGAVYVLLMNSDGTVKSHTKISDGLAGFTPSGLIGSDRFGSALASLGDLDGDGVVDLAVGASGDENTQASEGAVYVLLMNSNGTVKSHTKISDGLAGFTPNGLIGSDQFGSALASLGDLDGDGVMDLAVGALGDENTQASEGAVYVLLMNSNGTVKSHTKISDGLAGFTPNGLIGSDQFGSALASLGDLDGDGVANLAVGANFDENTQASEGAVYVLSMLSAPLQAAQGVAPASDNVAAALQGKDLTTIVRAAINLYAKSGLSAAQLQSLRQVDVRIVDLAGARLGQASGNVITIDVNAAGYGWFIDATPLKNEEFVAGSAGLLAAGDSAASGRMDLLTVVLHELGHVLGYDDHDSQSNINDLMYGDLATGLRKLPSG